MFTLLQGFVDIFSGFGIIVALFTLRFLVGLAEAVSVAVDSTAVSAVEPHPETSAAVIDMDNISTISFFFISSSLGMGSDCRNDGRRAIRYQRTIKFCIKVMAPPNNIARI